VKGVAALDGPCGHKRGSEDLEEEGYGHGETGDVATETAAQCKKTGEEADYREEERDEIEGEHEAGEVVVVVRSDKLLWHILSGAKVARRIEWQSRNRVPAVSIVSVLWVDAADGEKGPAGGIAGVGDSANIVGFKEVELVLWIAIDGAR